MNSEKIKGSPSKLRKPSEYTNSAKALLMRTGNFFVNYHGFCLFVTQRITYLPWKKTKEYGMLPPTQEYGRLRNGGCTEFTLTAKQEKLVWQIVQQLQKNPFYMLSRSELFIAKQGKCKRERELHKKTAVVKTLRPKKVVLHSFEQLRFG